MKQGPLELPVIPVPLELLGQVGMMERPVPLVLVEKQRIRVRPALKEILVQKE
jgi:hypothetical protein